MTDKQATLLEEARQHFYAWRMLDAYNIFRRFFDRLPFSPEKEHADFIGPFVRILFELGKDFELKFYLQELEKLYQKRRDPHIAYPLGVVYSYSGVEKMEAARQIFESIVKDPDAIAYHPKSRMMLADYHQRKGDIRSCRLMIDSISPNVDESTRILVEIWKAVVARCEKKFEQARDIIIALLGTITRENDWYGYFSAKNELAIIYIEMDDFARAEILVNEVEKIFDQGRFRMFKVQIDYLRAILREKKDNGPVKLVKRDTDLYQLHHKKQILDLNPKITQDRLLLTLLKKGFLEKALIVKGIYGREYVAEKDDKLIYYHVHILRKRLRALGLAAEVLVSEKEGYRWSTPVETTVEEL